MGALVSLTASLVFLDVPTRAEWSAAAFFWAFGFVAAALSYQTSSATGGSIGFLPWLSLAILSPNFAAPSVVLTSALAAELLARRPLVKAVFNAAQHTFAVTIALALYVVAGGNSVLDGNPAVGPFVLLALCYFVLNKLAVSTVVSAVSSGSTRVHWLKSIRSSAVYDVLAIPLVLFFAIAYARLGPLWSAVFALPMLGVRQLYRTLFALQKVNEDLLQLMVASIEARDPYTSGHSQRVSRYARVIASSAGLGERATDRVSTAALLHDVGKIHEEFAAILRKPGRLTDEEFSVMKTHPLRSAELVGRVSQFSDLVAPVRAHHEAWNGTGYPDQLAGEAIPLAARIIVIADTIDAMTTSRPYRSGLTAAEVREELRRQSGIQFDPRICGELLRPSRWEQLTAEIALANAEFPAITTFPDVAGRTGEYGVLSDVGRRGTA